MIRRLYCPICGQTVTVETDAQYPEILRIPPHTPRDDVNLCQGTAITVTIDLDLCKNCKRRYGGHPSGLCLACFGRESA